MKLAKPLLLAGALAALPLSALASELNYNFIEGGYLKATQEDGNADDFDYDGFSLGASGQISSNLYLFGDYRQLESDTVGGIRQNIDEGRVGLGVIVPVNQQLHLTAGGGAVFAKADFEGAGFTTGDEDDTGYFVQGIARAKVLPALEINGGYRYQKVFDEGDSTGLVGAVFNITPAFAAVGNYEFGDDFNRYVLGARFNF